jgi:hypothetical protein
MIVSWLRLAVSWSDGSPASVTVRKIGASKRGLAFTKAAPMLAGRDAVTSTSPVLHSRSREGQAGAVIAADRAQRTSDTDLRNLEKDRPNTCLIDTKTELPSSACHLRS